MSTIIESLTSDDFLLDLVPFEDSRLTAVVYAKVIRTQELSLGPGAQMVELETYEIVEMEVTHLKLIRPDGSTLKISEESAKMRPGTLMYGNWNRMMAAVERAVIKTAKAAPDFSWDAESNEEWSVL